MMHYSPQPLKPKQQFDVRVARRLKVTYEVIRLLPDEVDLYEVKEVSFKRIKIVDKNGKEILTQ